jgi:hypothetical protein
MCDYDSESTDMDYISDSADKDRCGEEAGDEEGTPDSLPEIRTKLIMCNGFMATNVLRWQDLSYVKVLHESDTSISAFVLCLCDAGHETEKHRALFPDEYFCGEDRLTDDILLRVPQLLCQSEKVVVESLVFQQAIPSFTNIRDIDYRRIEVTLAYLGADPLTFAALSRHCATLVPRVSPLGHVTSFIVCRLSSHLVKSHTPPSPRFFSKITALQGITELDILRYAMHYGYENQLIVRKHDLASPDVPRNVFDHLGLTTAVIAGSAASQLLTPELAFDMCSDVDIFVFDTEEADVIIKNIVRVCQLTGKYVVCQSGESVLTLVGYVTTRRLQIIRTRAKNVDALFMDFDLNACKAAFDGIHVIATCSCVLDTMTLTCNNGGHIAIEPTRLAKLFLRGFKITADAQRYLKDAIGFPLTDKIVNSIKYDFPFIPMLPIDGASSMSSLSLERYDLTMVSYFGHILPTLPLVILGQNRGAYCLDAALVYRDEDMDGYLCSVTIDTRPSFTHTFDALYYLQAHIVFRSPDGPESTEDNATWVTLMSISDVEKFAGVIDDLLLRANAQSSIVNCPRSHIIGADYNDLRVRLVPDETKWYSKGLELLTEPVHIRGQHAVVSLVPSHCVRDGSGVRFIVTGVYL